MLDLMIICGTNIMYCFIVSYIFSSLVTSLLFHHYLNKLYSLSSFYLSAVKKLKT